MGNVPATLGLMLPGDDMDTQVERWRALTVDDALARFSIDGETMARALKHTAPSLGDEDPMVGLHAGRCDGCHSVNGDAGAARARRAVSLCNVRTMHLCSDSTLRPGRSCLGCPTGVLLATGRAQPERCSGR